jgi:hypothetical protein
MYFGPTEGRVTVGYEIDNNSVCGAFAICRPKKATDYVVRRGIVVKIKGDSYNKPRGREIVDRRLYAWLGEARKVSKWSFMIGYRKGHLREDILEAFFELPFLPQVGHDWAALRLELLGDSEAVRTPNLNDIVEQG